MPSMSCRRPANGTVWLGGTLPMTHIHVSGHPLLVGALRTLAVAMLLASATLAQAQSGALSRADAQRRRALTAEATQLRRAGDHAGALSRAREAVAIGTTPALRRLVAEELEATGDLARAYQEFGGCLTDATAGRDRASQRACRTGQSRITPQLEWVRFAPVDDHQGAFRVFAHGAYQDPSAVPIAGESTEIRIEAPLRHVEVPQPSDEGRPPSTRTAASGEEQVILRRRASPGRRSVHLLTLPALGLSGDVCLVRATADATLDVVARVRVDASDAAASIVILDGASGALFWTHTVPREVVLVCEGATSFHINVGGTAERFHWENGAARSEVTTSTVSTERALRIQDAGSSVRPALVSGAWVYPLDPALAVVVEPQRQRSFHLRRTGQNGYDVVVPLAWSGSGSALHGGVAYLAGVAHPEQVAMLHAADYSTGRELFRVRLHGFGSPRVAAEGDRVIVLAGGTLNVLDARTGEVRFGWGRGFPFPPSPAASTPAP